MTGYRGVFVDLGDPTGLGGDAVEPMPSYRAVLDAARSVAHRHQTPVCVVDVGSGKPQMIVRPDGSTRKP